MHRKKMSNGIEGNSGRSRSDRVATEIKRVVSEALLRGEIGDGEFNPRAIVVTGVEVSSCLGHAKIFISSISDDIAAESCREFLELHAPQLRKCIGDNIRLKFVPTIRFLVDTSTEYAQKMEKLFASLHSSEEGAPN